MQLWVIEILAPFKMQQSRFMSNHWICHKWCGFWSWQRCYGARKEFWKGKDCVGEKDEDTKKEEK